MRGERAIVTSFLAEFIAKCLIHIQSEQMYAMLFVSKTDDLSE